MKTLSKVFLGAFALGLVTFNLSLSDKESPSHQLSMDNISVLQASAAEAYCDPSYRSCTITHPDGWSIQGEGNPVYQF